MLLEFSCANFRSIHKVCTLSMVAQKITDEPKNNIAYVNDKLNILKTAAIYGANSSGKSNVLNAFASMVWHIIYSVKLNDGDELRYEPFKLSSAGKEATYYEAKFILNGQTYRYGFEHDDKTIISEWLYSSSIGGKKEQILFLRNEDGIGVNEKSFPEGVDKEESTVENRLFLSLCAQLNGKCSKQIIDKFKTFNVISGINSNRYAGYSKAMLHKQLDGYGDAIDFFKTLQLGFESIQTKEREVEIPEDFPERIKEELTNKLKGKKDIELRSIHNVYDEDGRIVGTTLFDFDRAESEGTKKIIQLSGPIFDTLNRGLVLCVDEIDVKMHPLISQFIINLFNDPEKNTKNAQLIFTTHDTHLLSSKMLRRDQIWFTEKDATEQTDLYNMMDIELPDGSKPRPDANYKRNYIAGRYGAIPYIINE